MKAAFLQSTSVSALFGLGLALATPAFGQTMADPAKTDTVEKQAEPNADLQQPPAPNTDNSIIITGSRIRRPTLDSTVPITSIATADLVSRAEVSLGDALNDMPALRATFSQANSTTSIGKSGLSLLDLRGLGTARTLVLVNGRRHVTAQPGSYGVDVNTIPVDLLERTDFVTGGSSAVYGSDAIAGVVNFVLRRNFEGFRIRGQSGITTYGDRGNRFLTAIAGKTFFDGTLNVAVHGEYAKSNEVFYSDRPYLGAYSGPPGFITSQITNAPNRNFDGIPNTEFYDVQGGTVPGIRFGNLSTGGYVLVTCPTASASNAARRSVACTGETTPTGGLIARNYAFQPDGTLAPDVPFIDRRSIGGGVIGGLSATGIEDAMLLPGLERIVGNVLINGNVSSAFQPFLEAKFVRVNATQQSTQPTFVASTLNPVFRIDNPFLSDQARTLLTRLGPVGATTFQMQRFNNDLGTRAEDHQRTTWRIVGGVRGDISATGNLRYELALNYGRTKTYYETGGNVLVARFNDATNAVRDSVTGNIVCFINSAQDRIPTGLPNAGAINTANDDPACAPLNLFGYGASSQAARNYVLHKSWRRERASQFNALAFVSGDTEGLFETWGGPIGFSLGGEYRREKAFSIYDPVTRSGATFLNAFQPFQPPAEKIKEVFGELRIPLLKGANGAEVSVEGAARYSHYSSTGGVWAYNYGVTFAPHRSLRGRVSYAQAVRQPNLSNLYATAAQTFANGLSDPCDQPGGANSSNNITTNPARAANCAAAGVPTTITYVDANGLTVTRPWTNVPGSGVPGINRGNPVLRPEVSRSLTIGAVFQPEFAPGFQITVDYFRIKVKDVISGLTGQAILNRCYDDPTGINNEFCRAIFRRNTADPITTGTFYGQTNRRLDGRTQDNFPVFGDGVSFINQPYNFAALVREGIDIDVAYRRDLGKNIVLRLRGVASYLMRSENFSYLTQPDRSDRLLRTLGDPKWAASWNANLDFGRLDVTYSGVFNGRQSILSWETQFTHQGRGPTNPDARPFRYYPAQMSHSLRANFEATKRFRFYGGVDNIFNKLPPYDLTGLEAGNPYSPTGRFFYVGAAISLDGKK